MASNATAPRRIVVFIQENKTPDFYFRSLAAFGADISRYRSILAAAPDYDQPHDRNAWVHYRMGDYPAVRTQINNDTLIPFYSWLAKTFTFCDHHFGLGTNSTSGHLLAIGASIPKTIVDLFALPHTGIPLIDTAPSFVSSVDASLRRPPPPAFGTVITQPRPPSPRPAPVPPPPWTGPTNQTMPAIILNGGKTIPAPRDGVVRTKPPTPPKP